MKKIKLQISGMHCTACVMNIDGELEDTKGVKSASTNYAKQTSEVEFDPEFLTENKILEIIESLGYKATLHK
jgi:copper chaperone CopZ